MGAKHQPSYRIVVADSRSPRDGRYIDQVGFYNPLTNPAIITINQERAEDWLRRGAQPSDTVAILLQKMNINPGEVRGGKKGATPNPLAPRVPVSQKAGAASASAAPATAAPASDAPSAEEASE